VSFVVHWFFLGYRETDHHRCFERFAPYTKLGLCCTQVSVWGCSVKLIFLMHRRTARFLLILLLVSIFAPVGLAISTPAPHACCMRKPMHDRGSHDSEFNAPPGCCNHDCCRPLTVSHWAHVAPAARNVADPIALSLNSAARPFDLTSAVDSAHSGRAPPQFSIA